MPNIPISDKEKKAWEFAEKAHKGQVRKFGNKSYFDAHVKNVNAILKKYTKNEDILVASILHDVVEDCYKDQDVGLYIIEKEFSEKISDLVKELTSIKKEIKDDYEGSKTEYLCDKMLMMSNDALTIKLADRLQNISDLFTSGKSFRYKYNIETLKIVDDLERNRTLTSIQNHLIDDIKAKLANVGKMFNIKRKEPVFKIKRFKEYKIFEKIILNNGEFSKFLENKINKNLISDLKELSMDLLDKNYELYITIHKLDYYGEHDFRIVTITISHKDDYYYWLNVDLLSGDKLGYEFFYEYCGVSPSNINDEITEVEVIIKEMYPDENIKSI